MAISNAGERKLAALQSILVATDASAQDSTAVRRAEQLAQMHGARLKRVPLPPRPEDLLADARGMDLVVLPHRWDRSVAAVFMGQPVLRLLRGSPCPVLVVRGNPAPRYRRILVAVDFSPAADELVRFAAGFDDAAQLELFHALSTREEAKLRSAEASEHAVRAYQARRLEHAQQQMLSLTDSLQASGRRLFTVVERGDPGRQAVLRQERSGADLVVVGKSGSSAWGDILCGSVAERVLSWGSSDVLLLPPARSPATAAVAAQRLKPGAHLPLGAS